jgi:HEAT repeat protein
LVPKLLEALDRGIAAHSIGEFSELPDDPGRDHAAIALRNIGQAAVLGLVERVGHSSARVRRVAVEALGGMGKDAAMAVPLLRTSLRDPDAETRRRAVFALQNLGAAEASLPDLRLLLHDESANVREALAIVLGQLGLAASAAFPDLRKLLFDQERDVRYAALVALRHVGQVNDVIPLLRRMLVDVDDFVQGEARVELRAIDPID